MDDKNEQRSGLDKFISFMTNYKLIMVAIILIIIILSKCTQTKMRNSVAWIFGLIFLAVFVYIGWNGFELPKVILGETNITTGKIVDISV